MSAAASQPKIKVYAGLSLSRADVAAHLPSARFAPPVCRGDLSHDIAGGFNAVVIIDGSFYFNGPKPVMAVAPSEILDALRSGVFVAGASSMGALRAVELERYGMLGYGRIFEHIRAAPVFEDDLLGHLYFDRPVPGGAPLTYIDFHFNVQDLAQAGECSAATSATLTAAYRALHYSKRTWPALQSALEKTGFADARTLATARRAFVGMGSQKRRDAIGLLKLVKRRLSDVARANARLNASC